MACEECRRRRISCDNAQPKCHHCERLSKTCVYTDLNGRKPIQRKSYKEIETRLAKLEAQLAASSTPSGEAATESASEKAHRQASKPLDDCFSHSDSAATNTTPYHGIDSYDIDASNHSEQVSPVCHDISETSPSTSHVPDYNTTCELNRIFFDLVHPNIPILSPTRMLEVQLLSKRAFPLCLQYAIWTHAAVQSSKYASQVQQFYLNSRMHLEFAESEDMGSGSVSVAHAQAWLLIGAYECEQHSVKQAYLSNDRAVSLCKMFGLGQLDSNANSAATLSLPEDHIEAEEWRRTFWYVVYSNQWATSGAIGSPGNLLGDTVTTLLPCSEEAFYKGEYHIGPALRTVVRGALPSDASPMVLAILSGEVLTKTREVNQHLTNTGLCLPEGNDSWWQYQQLRSRVESIIRNIPHNLHPTITTDPLALHINMSFYSFSISLDQAMLDTGAKNALENVDLNQIRARQKAAATAIVKIMDIAMKKGIGVNRMYPFAPALLYIASTIFVNDFKTNETNTQAREVVKFIIQIMRVFVQRTPTAQMFLSQLSSKLLENNIDIVVEYSDIVPAMRWNGYEDDFKFLGPLFEDRMAMMSLYPGQDLDLLQRIF